MNQDFSQDEDDGRVIYGVEDDNEQSPDQSQDDRDAGAAVYSKYNYPARKRLGLVGRDQSDSMLLGSEDLERNLRQQRSPPRADLNQNLTNILQQYNDPEAEASQHDNEHLLPGHGDYSPQPVAATHSPGPAAFSPRGRFAGHADSPGGGRLTAASQATGIAAAAARQQFRPRSATAAAAAPVLGGAGVFSAGGIEVDEELLNLYEIHKATSPPNSKKKDNRRLLQHQQQHGPRQRATPPSLTTFGGTGMNTPGPVNPAVNNNPLLSLLASAKGNNGSSRGDKNGGSGGGRNGNGTPSQFRQPVLGTPGGRGGSGGGASLAPPPAAAGPSRFQREQQQRNTTHTATPPPASATGNVPHTVFRQQQQQQRHHQQQQQQQQEEMQDIILTSDDEDAQNPATAATGGGDGGAGINTPVAAHVAAFGANAGSGAPAPTGGAAAAPGSGSGGSAQRLPGPQDSFLANLAPPSTRITHGNARSRLGGASGAVGSGLQGRLKRVRMADEHAAAAAAAAAAANNNNNANNTNTHILEAVIQGRGIEGSVLKLLGLCRNTESNAYFIIGSKAAADRTDLTLGRKMLIRRPWREVPPNEDGIKVFLCTGEVSAQ